MSKGLFVTATGTDVGKTYVTALLIKTLRDAGYSCGYYKAALSGTKNIEESDAGYVSRIAGFNTQIENVSYMYRSAVSPHLAAKIEGNPLKLEKVIEDYKVVEREYEYIITEGSGGIVCPIRWDDKAHIMLEDIIKALNLPVVIVADAGLGTINATVLTVEHLKNKQIAISGIILNHYEENAMHADNKKMLEELTDLPVIATVKENANALTLTAESISALFSKGESL